MGLCSATGLDTRWDPAALTAQPVQVARSVEANGLSAGRVQQLLEGATAEVLREQRLFLDWGVDAPRVDIVKTVRHPQ